LEVDDRPIVAAARLNDHVDVPPLDAHVDVFVRGQRDRIAMLVAARQIALDRPVRVEAGGRRGDPRRGGLRTVVTRAKRADGADQDDRRQQGGAERAPAPAMFDGSDRRLSRCLWLAGCRRRAIDCTALNCQPSARSARVQPTCPLSVPSLMRKAGARRLNAPSGE
jgi:hypothetical protein